MRVSHFTSDCDLFFRGAITIPLLKNGVFIALPNLAGPGNSTVSRINNGGEGYIMLSAFMPICSCRSCCDFHLQRAYGMSTRRWRGPSNRSYLFPGRMPSSTICRLQLLQMLRLVVPIARVRTHTLPKRLITAKSCWQLAFEAANSPRSRPVYDRWGKNPSSGRYIRAVQTM